MLVLCGLAFGYLTLSGRMAALLSPGIAALETVGPPPSAESGGFAPTATFSPTQLLPTLIPSPRPTVSYSPFLEKSACAFDLPNGVNVSCGYLIVPEDRTEVSSRTIRLAVAVFHSRSQDPAPDPVIFLQGGPGAEAVELSAAAYEILVAPFLPERDFIALDQRGTGLSQPNLKCEELTATFSQDIHGLIEPSTRKLVYSNAFVSCHGLMSSQGIDLNSYTTVASAADVKDLLSVLGYQKADLYGASYGTRLAQVIMRDYPEIVRSAILDSVVPVETNLFYRYPDAIESSLETLFDSCAADPACNTAYPGLEDVFWELAARLDAQPISVTTSSMQTGTLTETVDGSTFMGIVLGSLKHPQLIGTAPQSIYRLHDGDYSTLIAAQGALPFAFEGISPGLYISMMCHEHVFAITPEELQSAMAARQDIREYAWLPFYGNAEDLYRTCKSWGSIGPVSGENAPVVSDLPALIITGKYDPATPPMYARQLTAQLSHSYYFEFPDQGHTPTAGDFSGCAMDLVLSFLAEPETEPDHSCLDRMDGVDFLVPYTGIPALPLKTARAWGASVEVPADWYRVEEGVYLRSNSPLDITQAAVLQAPISAAELQDWFSSKAYGYRGLDSALIPAGQRSANGLAWNLYTSTSYSRPVDIAMADVGGGRSLVLMLFCNNDEHDPLYRTAFLPMVDSARLAK